MIRVLVSSCLLGERVRYHGGDARYDHETLGEWIREGRIVPFCPEVEGGLGIPRPAAEIRGGDGAAVLDGEAEVVTREGRPVTTEFVRGARRALAVAQRQGVGLAILTERSPSCGSEVIHDGSFSGTTRQGSGVTSALLERHGIRVFSPQRLEAAAKYLERLEASRGGGG